MQNRTELALQNTLGEAYVSGLYRADNDDAMKLDTEKDCSLKNHNTIRDKTKGKRALCISVFNCPNSNGFYFIRLV